MLSSHRSARESTIRCRRARRRGDARRIDHRARSTRFCACRWGAVHHDLLRRATTGNNANGGASVGDAKLTIQAAIDAVDAGGQVRVLPGSYHEAAPNSLPTTIAGSYQFGLFFGSSKPGISLIGVTAADVEITDANVDPGNDHDECDQQLRHRRDLRRGRGHHHPGCRDRPERFRRQQDDRGRRRQLHPPLRDDGHSGRWGAIYIDDFSAGGTVVQSYHILDNVFPDGTSVALASGAGNTGPVSGREILRNTFDLGNNGFNAISFNGSGGVPWFVNPVGGAIITDNTFAHSTQYIRARGVYAESEFDWASYWNDNTFDKAAVALVTQVPFDVRSYSYTERAVHVHQRASDRRNHPRRSEQRRGRRHRARQGRYLQRGRHPHATYHAARCRPRRHGVAGCGYRQRHRYRLRRRAT